MTNKNIMIDEALVYRLVSNQFPQWKNLSIKAVSRSGWDNRTFHLGEDMLVRMPSDEPYALQVEKEQTWLPKLAATLPCQIPQALAMGQPTPEYPWKWSIYRWIDGETVAASHISNLNEFAKDLARFLLALQRADATEGPEAGLHSFYRGGNLRIYDDETRKAFYLLKDKIDVLTATEIWESALATSWSKAPVWVHGDISPGNLLIHDGRLNAVIDFGQLAIGDPACDLAIAWTFFKDESRETFRKELPLDAATWLRGRAWTLWKALIVAAGLTESNNAESKKCWLIIDDIVSEYKGYKKSP